MAGQGAAAKAFEQLQALGDLALESSTIGTLPELRDALPRLVPGSNPLAIGTEPPETAGTPFQAWTHGEYVRNVWEDLVGVRYLAVDRVALSPRLPPGWGTTRARFRMGGGFVTATIAPGEGKLDVELEGEGTLPAAASVVVNALGDTEEVAVSAGATGKATLAGTPGPTGWEGFAWLDVVLPPNLASLEYPGFVVLDRAAIKQPPDATVAARLALTDPGGDDTGPAGQTYTYPTDLHFQPGILDLVGFELREDADAFFFRLSFTALTQPGWNPQDGFQLTYAAIALDTGAAVQGTVVGHKSGYTMPAGTGFEFAVYVGAGFEVQDAEGNVIASYVPQAGDVVDPLGSPDTGEITFRVPKTVIPALPAATEVTLLVGSQEDYGTGIMGDFRQVSTTASQWVGGGNTLGGPYVYDFAFGTTN
jgi:hypothetical protein